MSTGLYSVLANCTVAVSPVAVCAQFLSGVAQIHNHGLNCTQHDRYRVRVCGLAFVTYLKA